MDFFLATWIFAFGACVGSFLNVVIWRLPRGETLLGFSRCPKCESPIAARDNLPILAWILLRGKCRKCRKPISARYPKIEFVTAAIFLGLAYLELAYGGVNLPGYAAPEAPGFESILLPFRWDLVRIWSYHTTLLCVLLSCAMIVYDRQRLPYSLLGFALLVGGVLPAVWPDVHPLPCCDAGTEPALARFATSAAGLTAGALVGALLGVLVTRLPRSRPRFVQQTATHIAILFATIGIFLGWQAVLVIAAAWTVTRLVAMAGDIRTTSGPKWGIWILALTIFLIAFWSQLPLA